MECLLPQCPIGTHDFSRVFGRSYRRLQNITPFQHDVPFSNRGQTERTIQTLKDMLRACTLDFKGAWDEQLALIEFSYNNSYYSSIGMAPYEALCGRKCKTLLCLQDINESLTIRLDLIQVIIDKIRAIQERIKMAQSHQKSCADRRCRTLEFEAGDRVFLEVCSTKGIAGFGVVGKLSLRYIGPYLLRNELERWPTHQSYHWSCQGA